MRGISYLLEFLIDLQISNYRKTRNKTLRVIIDTGYMGEISINKNIANELGLEIYGEKDYRLANGAPSPVDQSMGYLTVDGKEVLSIIDIQRNNNASVLIGTTFLIKLGYDLLIDFQNDIIELNPH